MISNDQLAADYPLRSHKKVHSNYQSGSRYIFFDTNVQFDNIFGSVGPLEVVS